MFSAHGTEHKELQWKREQVKCLHVFQLRLHCECVLHALAGSCGSRGCNLPVHRRCISWLRMACYSLHISCARVVGYADRSAAICLWLWVYAGAAICTCVQCLFGPDRCSDAWSDYFLCVCVCVCWARGWMTLTWLRSARAMHEMRTATAEHTHSCHSNFRRNRDVLSGREKNKKKRKKRNNIYNSPYP